MARGGGVCKKKKGMFVHWGRSNGRKPERGECGSRGQSLGGGREPKKGKPTLSADSRRAKKRLKPGRDGVARGFGEIDVSLSRIDGQG